MMRLIWLLMAVGWLTAGPAFSQQAQTENPGALRESTAAQNHEQKAQPVPSVLTNQDVLDMLKAGLTREIVVAKIKSSPSNFDTSPAALTKLKAEGVPDSVILAMVEAPVLRPKPDEHARSETTQSQSSTARRPTLRTPSEESDYATHLHTQKQPVASKNASGSMKAARRGESPQEKSYVYVTDSQSWEMTGGWYSQSSLHGSFTEGTGTVSGSSHGAGHISGGARPQTVEVIKTLNQRCPELVVTIDRARASYVILFDHEGGKGLLRNKDKIAVANRSGDVIFSGSTRSLGNAVKDACDAIGNDTEKAKK